MRIKKYIPLLVIILTFPSIGQWMNIQIGETVYWWATNIILLLLFFLYHKKNKKITPKMPTPIKYFMLYAIFASVYGFFLAEGYWDWKNLISNTMIYLMCISFYYLSIPSNLSDMTHKWCIFGTIAFWFLLPFMQFEAPGKYLIPFSFLIIFWPFIKGKWRYIIFFFFLIVFIYGSLGARSSVLKYSISAIFSLCFILHRSISSQLLLKISYFFLILPLILFCLGVTQTFNIFKIDEYLNMKDEIVVQNSYGEKGEIESLTVDTRTFLYAETLNSAIKHNYIIQGHSLARGYESYSFGDTDLISKKRGERSECEVSILNVFTRMGIIGVTLYFTIFAGAVFKVRKHSKNYMMYVVACYVAFRWTFAWIEDFTRFDLNNLFLWGMITMCYSPYYLNMTNKDVSLWFNSFFKSNPKQQIRLQNYKEHYT